MSDYLNFALESICALPLFCHVPVASNAAGTFFTISRKDG